VEESTTKGLDAAARPQVIVMTVDDGGRQQPISEQPTRAIEVGEHCIQQASALLDGLGQKTPLLGADD
jgi:hypothetical protein